MKLIKIETDEDDSLIANYYKCEELNNHEQLKKFINELGKQWKITNITFEYYNDHDTFNPPIEYKNLEEFNEEFKGFINEDDIIYTRFNMSQERKKMKATIAMDDYLFYTFEEKK